MRRCFVLRHRYDDDFVRGVVDRVNLRSGTLWLRDQRTDRLIEADMRGTGRQSRVNLRDLRRGDYVELMGDWSRGGVFDVDRVAEVRNGRGNRNGRW